uniref:Snake toxin/toxin-like domain-containing protein n=1 Tax=Sarcophilus harrisii TaxID=9305 RepID=G3WZU6_SARHA
MTINAIPFPSHPGNTLICYTCKEPTDIYKCRNISICNHGETSCKTRLENVESEYPFFNNAMVTRSCSNNCVATDPDTIGLAHPVSCCYRDLCNTDNLGFPQGDIPHYSISNLKQGVPYIGET